MRTRSCGTGPTSALLGRLRRHGRGRRHGVRDPGRPADRRLPGVADRPGRGRAADARPARARTGTSTGAAAAEDLRRSVRAGPAGAAGRAATRRRAACVPGCCGRCRPRWRWSPCSGRNATGSTVAVSRVLGRRLPGVRRSTPDGAQSAQHRRPAGPRRRDGQPAPRLGGQQRDVRRHRLRRQLPPGRADGTLPARRAPPTAASATCPRRCTSSTWCSTALRGRARTRRRLVGGRPGPDRRGHRRRRRDGALGVGADLDGSQPCSRHGSPTSRTEFIAPLDELQPCGAARPSSPRGAPVPTPRRDRAALGPRTSPATSARSARRGRTSRRAMKSVPPTEVASYSERRASASGRAPSPDGGPYTGGRARRRCRGEARGRRPSHLRGV